jgi:hypothetical protein
MKKLFFLLLIMVIGAGLATAMDAVPSHPPGILGLEIALSGYGTEPVTPDTVLVTQRPMVLAASLMAIPVEVPHITIIKPINTGQEMKPVLAVDYPLLC